MKLPIKSGTAIALALWAIAGQTIAQERRPNYQVDVNLVGLTFSVTDSKGKPIRGLQRGDITIEEDGIPQKIAAFAEGSNGSDDARMGVPQGTNIFILFDTSDHMYLSIPYVRDAVAEFLRNLVPSDSAALYTFSRNLFRAAPLTRDRELTRAALAQRVSAGDDTALFNCLLLTLRDAARVPGRKAVVVFSNGRDNRSMVSPDDVGTVAEDDGIPVYIASTLDPDKDGITANALQRLTARTGGQLILASKWQGVARAFSAIHEEIGASYTAYYYPAPNPNEGFRRITVKVTGPKGNKCTIHTRTGYHPRRSGMPETN